MGRLQAVNGISCGVEYPKASLFCYMQNHFLSTIWLLKFFTKGLLAAKGFSKPFSAVKAFLFLSFIDFSKRRNVNSCIAGRFVYLSSTVQV